MSDLERKAQEQELEQEQAQATAEAPMVSSDDGTVDAPFLSDVDAAGADLEQDADAAAHEADDDNVSPFADILEKANEAAAAAAKEKKPKKSSSTKSKKKGLDLSHPVPKLEAKDPSEVPMRWYVLQAFSGFEQRVAQALAERIRIQHMEDYFGQILVPKERVKDQDKDGKKRESERKFFPGYVLIEMKMTSDSWQLVKHTERVLYFVAGTPDHP